MNFLRNIFRFFIYSNLFIACCAMLMLAQTSSMLLSSSVSGTLLAFVGFATICSYSFHWYLTPVSPGDKTDRSIWLTNHRNIHIWLFIIGAAGVAVYGLRLLDHWIWLLFAAGITFLYSAPKIPHPWFRLLRKIAIGKTIFLAAVWMFVTTLLPLGISDQQWEPSFTLFCISRFFLIYAICILFDYRDREHDITLGIRSLITWMNEKSIDRLFLFSIAIFLTSSILLFRYGQSTASIIAIIVPGLITTFLYSHSKKNSSDFLYYFILDGLMCLSALLYYLF
jgi:4-hydroxybenzoate polyprenyltransferase